MIREKRKICMGITVKGAAASRQLHCAAGH